MAISFELQAHADASVADVFHTVSDLGNWDGFGGVTLVGPRRRVAVGDRIEIRLRVMRRDIQSGCVVRTVEEPAGGQPGYVDLRSVDGPFEARMIGTATGTENGCDLSVEVYGIGRGAARMLERPVDIVMRQWAHHQLRHLLAIASRSLLLAGAN